MTQHQWPGGPAVPPEFRQMAERFRHRSHGSLPWLILLVLAVLLGGYTSYYQVETEETGVILRLGKFHGFAEPGLHYKIPFGVDRVFLVKTGRVLKEEFGFRTLRPGTRTTYSPQSFDDESLTLTGDLNVSDIEWIVQFQVADPYKFLFRIHEPVDTLRDIAESAVRATIGNSNVDEVLTTERAALAGAIERDLQKTLDAYDIGVRIVKVNFQNVNPPEAVKAAFNEVNEAEQQRETLIFQAREQYNMVIPRAGGEAKQLIQEAEGYAIERTNRAEGEAARFRAILAEYRKAPEVTRRRLYLETLEEVLPKLEQITVVDGAGARVVPLLNLGATPGGKP